MGGLGFSLSFFFFKLFELGSDCIAQAGLELIGSRHPSALLWADELQAVVTVSLWFWGRHSLTQLLLSPGCF